MSACYLVPCPACQQQLPVEAGKAGGTVTCTCGQTLDVPTMHKLRKLPQEAPAEGVASTSAMSSELSGNSNWGPRQGLLLLGVLLILVGGGLALYKVATFPPSPYKTQQQIHDLADVHFDTMTLRESWEFWKTYIEPQGLTTEPNPYEEEYEEKAAHERQYVMIFSTIAGIGAVVFIAGLLVKNH